MVAIVIVIVARLICAFPSVLWGGLSKTEFPAEFSTEFSTVATARLGGRRPPLRKPLVIPATTISCDIDDFQLQPTLTGEATQLTLPELVAELRLNQPSLTNSGDLGGQPADDAHFWLIWAVFAPILDAPGNSELVKVYLTADRLLVLLVIILQTAN